LGMPGLPIVTIPHPMARQRPERVAEIAGQSIPEIIHILTTDAAGLEREYKAKTIVSRAKLRYKTLFGDNFSLEKSPDKFKAPTSLEAINKLLYARGWTDGLPIIPPTEERVKEMISHYGWNPQEVIGLLPPKRGEASVEKIAINAVMAGCIPEYLPVVIAATRAMIQKDFNLYGLQTTTHLCTVMVLLNGPMAEELGINCGYNAMGQGNMANATIGRAIRLVLTNIGGASPGILDRATFGSPAKYSFCFAENEAENPWEPFHVERGFPKSLSTVTVFGVEGPHNVNDHGSQSAEEVLLTISGVLATPGTNHIYLGGEPLIVLGPEHAQIISSDGFSKAEVKQFLYEKARVPLKLISRGNLDRFRKIWPDRFSRLDSGDNVPIAVKPEDILVIVAGGQGRHSAVIPSFGATKAITVPVTDRDGQPIFVKERKSGTGRD